MSYPKYRVIELPFVNSPSWWGIQKKGSWLDCWERVYSLTSQQQAYFETEKEAVDACRLHVETLARDAAHYKKLDELRKKAKIIPIT